MMSSPFLIPSFYISECKDKADIIFLVDVSSSIGHDRFQSMQKFMASLVDQTTVGADLTRFGIILYSDDPKTVFTLKQYSTKRDVLQAIEELKYLTGNTYTAKALTYSLPFFDKDHGGRAALKVPQVLMVITDGDASDAENLVSSSSALRKQGISVYSIGVEKANQTQLDVMAGGDKSKVFYVDNFKALEKLYKNITNVLCKPGKKIQHR